MKPSLDLNALHTFALAVHHGSMAKAAAKLGIPKSTVSRHLGKVEGAVGALLLRRLPHGLEPTVEGRLLYDRIADSISSLHAAGAQAASSSDEQPSFDSLKPLRIRAPIVFGRGFLPEVFSDALWKFPTLRIELDLTDRLFDPNDDAYDINFCVGIDIPFQLEAWPLGNLEAKLFASPSFASRHLISNPDELNQVPLISVPCGSDSNVPLALTSIHGQMVQLASKPLVVANDNQIICQLTAAGHGVGRLPAFFAAPFVEAGTLVAVLPEWTVDRHIVQISVRRGYRQKVVQALLEFLISELSTKVQNNW